MTLIDSLSAIRQKLVASVPVSLGVKQYIPVVLTYSGSTYNFTAKITELTPGQKVSYMSSGVMVNNETRSIENIPFAIPEEAVQNGTYAYSSITAEPISINTRGTVSYSAIVQEYRNR